MTPLRSHGTHRTPPVADAARKRSKELAARVSSTVSQSIKHSKWSGVTPLCSASRDAGLRSVHDGQWRRRAHADIQEHHAMSTQHEAAPEPVISGVAVFKVIRTLKFDLTVIIACGLHI